MLWTISVSRSSLVLMGKNEAGTFDLHSHTMIENLRFPAWFPDADGNFITANGMNGGGFCKRANTESLMGNV
jgi:hypothetical protein